MNRALLLPLAVLAAIGVLVAIFFGLVAFAGFALIALFGLAMLGFIVGWGNLIQAAGRANYERKLRR